MNKITTDEQFIKHLAKKLGIGEPLTNWYWFGGESPISPDSKDFTDESMHKWLDDQIGYLGDSDNPDEYYQHMYDNNLLDWDAIYYITSGHNLPVDKAFLCIWGEGYTDADEPASIECHGYPFFTKDNGFSHYQVEQANNLLLGESMCVKGMMEIMTIVRVF